MDSTRDDCRPADFVNRCKPRAGLHFTSICFDSGLQCTCDAGRHHHLSQQNRKQLRVLSLLGFGNETVDAGWWGCTYNLVTELKYISIVIGSRVNVWAVVTVARISKPLLIIIADFLSLQEDFFLLHYFFCFIKKLLLYWWNDSVGPAGRLKFNSSST